MITNHSKAWSRAIGIFITIGYFVVLALSHEELGPPFKQFLSNSWPWLLWGAGITVLVVLLRLFNEKFRQFSDVRKGLLVTIVALPLLIVVLNAIILLPDALRDRTLVILFVLVAAVLPPVMYYLFLITRRPSLFDEYVTNLERLGLIPAERRRVDAYLEKFEATYGPIEPDRRQQALGELVPGGTSATAAGSWGRLAETRVGSLMTPSILLPLGLCTLLVGIGWMIVLPVWDSKVSLMRPALTAVGFGFVGAYFYSLQSLFRRYLRRDLRPSIYISMGQRVVLTIVGTWVLTALLLGPGTWARSAFDSAFERLASKTTGATHEGPGEGAGDAQGQGAADDQETDREVAENDESAEGRAGDGAGDEVPQPVNAGAEEPGDAAPDGDGGAANEGDADGGGKSEMGTPRTLLVLAFLIGIFPRLLWDLLVSKAGTWTGVRESLERMSSDMPLGRIDGLSFWHQARLEEEDVENAPNLATADMVELMLNTRYAPGRIIDWIDQAILVTALGSDDDGHAKALRAHGIRTASALLRTYHKSSKYHDRRAFEGLLDEPKGRSAIRTLVGALKTNPNLRLVLNWQKDLGRPGHDDRGKA